MRISRAVILVLLIAGTLAFTQTTVPPQTPMPPPAAQQPAHSGEATGRQGQTQAPPRGDRSAEQDTSAKPTESKLTKEQSEELFRSVDEILGFVSQDTGLPIKHPVKRQLANREEVERFIAGRMKDDPDAKRLERSEVVLKKFGLVPRDFSLRQFLLALLKEQVAGFYDAKSKTVYLLDWVEPEQQKPVLAHELTHALQDQNFGLEEMAKATKKNDPTGLEQDERAAAIQALTEGQAMIVLLDYSLVPAGSSVAQSPQLVDLMESQMTSSGPGMAVYNKAPFFLQQVLLFPYRYGTVFERDLLVEGGKNKAFLDSLKNPPKDTRQILEPATYLQGQFLAPGKPLDFDKLARDYKKWDLSAMGEFDVVLLVGQYASSELAKPLSRQWRGGYYWAALPPSAGKANPETPVTGDIALAYVSHWATADAAQQFAAVYSDAVPKRYPGAYKVNSALTTTRREAPGTGIQVSVTPRLNGATTWQTREGLVSVESREATVLVLESFDPESAAKIREAAFSK